jgi:hypothetical protein
MYKDGVYTGVIEKIKTVIDGKLDSEKIFSSKSKSLEDYY